jgi:hypothetical protein
MEKDPVSKTFPFHSEYWMMHKVQKLGNPEALTV